MSLRIAFASIAAAFSQVISAQTLDGKWLGRDGPQAEVACWLIDRKVDGTYAVEFLVRERPGLVKHVETGTWHRAGVRYITVAETFDGQPIKVERVKRTAAYQIEYVSNESFVYFDVPTKVRFRVQRVPESWTLGSKCPL